MKHIAMGEINKFQCVGSKCLYTCCANWDVIFVDKETDEYYQSVEGKFGEELKEGIDRSREKPMLKMRNGRCVFLNEDDLCRIYMELGAEHMCKICQEYPRKEYMAGDILFHCMNISCLEAGRLLFSRKGPVELRVMEDDIFRKRYPVKFPDWTFFHLAELAFHVNLALLQNRSYSVAERERAFLLFNRSVQDALDAGKIAEAETLIKYFSVPENYASLVGSKLLCQLPGKVRLFRELSELFLTKPITPVFLRLFINSVRYIQSENADMDAISDMLKTLDGETFQREQEHVLAYLLFNHYLSDKLLDKDANRNLFGNAVFILTLFQFYRIFTAIFSAEKGEPADINSRLLIASYLSRHFEHSQETLRQEFQETLEKRGFYDMGFLFQLLS